jgi:hypothetical protein
MASSKNVKNYPLIPAAGQSMATSFTLGPIDVYQYQGLSIELTWSGTPTGTFALKGSNIGAADHNPPPLPLSASIAAAGSPDTALIDIISTQHRFLQVAYTATSGTGTLTVAQVTSKES